MKIVSWRGREFTEEMRLAVHKRLRKAGLYVEATAKKLCPVDTGNLRASITSQLDKEEMKVDIGTNVEYAAPVELGTLNRAPKPYLRPALEQNKQTIKELFKK